MILKNIHCLGQVHTLSRTGSHKIVYPVQGREAKNHTLSSGTSPYRPYKGVTPGVCMLDTNIIIEKGVEYPLSHQKNRCESIDKEVMPQPTYLLP